MRVTHERAVRRQTTSGKANDVEIRTTFRSSTLARRHSLCCSFLASGVQAEVQRFIDQMKIAYFHTGTILTSWSIFSLASTMRALGHEVLDASIPTGANGVVLRQVRPTQLQQVRAELPTLHDLEGCDVILVAGPEYVATWLN